MNKVNSTYSIFMWVFWKRIRAQENR